MHVELLTSGDEILTLLIFAKIISGLLHINSKNNGYIKVSSASDQS